MILRAAAIWLLLLFVAVLAGTLRTALLQPRMGEQSAHVIGTLVVVVAFTAVIWGVTPWVVPSLDAQTLLFLGMSWTIATVLFEFGFGHYVAGHTWNRLFADYNVAAGRVWILVLLTILVMPSVVGVLRR